MSGRLLALAIGLTALAVAGLAGLARPALPAQALGFAGQSSLKLVRFRTRTLERLPGNTIDVGSGGCASRDQGTACWAVPPWSFSPDGAHVALARNTASTVRGLRLVDVARLRVAGDVPLSGGPIGALAWVTPEKLLAIQEICCSERQRLLLIDVARGRVEAREALSGSIIRIGRTPRGLVMLVAPVGGIGPASLAVTDDNGAVRYARLQSITAGTRPLQGDHRFEKRLPALAVDAGGGRAFVIDRTLVAEIDLGSLSVSYHQPRQRAPSARSKLTSGFWREGRWLGGGAVAVSGADEERSPDAHDAEQTRTRPYGLRLLDTRHWSVRTVDPEATSFLFSGDLLLATGAVGSNGTGTGLAAYGRTGRRRFHLFAGRQAWLAEIVGNRAFVGVSRSDGREERLRVVDLSHGRVIGTKPEPLPTLLLGRASGWWGG